jgi:hypothetical protein
MEDIVIACIIILFILVMIFKDIRYQKDVYARMGSGAGENENFGMNLLPEAPNNITFVEKESVCDFLRADKDYYVRYMSEYDIIARKCKSKKEYIENSCKKITNFTSEEKQKLIECCKEVDDYLDNQKEIFKVSGEKLGTNLRWNLTSFINNETPGSLTEIQYEGGFPHTRAEFIFLPKTILSLSHEMLCGILLHEKIHIFQRFHYFEIHDVLKEMGFKKVRHISTEPLVRANPDTNYFIYSNKHGKENICQYNSEFPKNIQDIDCSYKEEHPYEILAYNVEKEFYLYYKEKYSM